jgi:two-component sensor histidine kinase
VPGAGPVSASGSPGPARIERILLALLSRPPSPFVLRYATTLLLVGVAFLLRTTIASDLGHHPFLFFILAVLLANVLFDQDAGVFATFSSTLLAGWLFAAGGPETIPGELLLLVLFMATGLLLSAVVEGLRRAVRTLEGAKERNALLLEELAHRAKNDLTVILSLLSLQARNEADPAARAALDNAAARIRVVVKARERLDGRIDEAQVALGPYLESLCAGMGELLRGVRPIAVKVRAEGVELPSSQATNVGLIVNELLTNALKYAFPDGRGGSVVVDLARHGDRLVLTVADDGVGCPAEAGDGLGTRLVRLLAAGMHGTVTREPAAEGCRVVVELALGE